MHEPPYPHTTELPERREHPRYEVDAAATVYSVGSSPVQSRVIELSRIGCRVKTAQPLHLPAQARVEISFNVRGIAFRLPGVTEWSDDHHLFGVQFTALSPRREGELVELLHELEIEEAARAAKKAAPPEPPAQLQSATLFALKKGTTADQFPKDTPEGEDQPAAESSAPSAEGEADQTIPFPAPDEPRPQRRERRQQKRHSVNSRATVYLINLRSQREGLIMDVSLSGCRIRTDEQFPVGIYRRVEVGFVLDGLPFRLAGVTQSVHNRFTVGIRFLDISERKREQLQFVIDEIEEMRQDGTIPVASSQT